METFEDFQNIIDEIFEVLKFVLGGLLLTMGIIFGFFPYAHNNYPNNIFILISVIAISIGGAIMNNSPTKLR